MGRALGVVWQSIKDFYDDLFPFIGMNLIWLIPSALLSIALWFVFSIALVIFYGQPPPTGDDPGQILAFLGLLILLIIAPNPAAAGVHYFANRKVNDELLEFSLFWEGLRIYWKKAFLLFLISTGGIALLLVNIAFYLTRDSQVLQVLAMVFVWVLFLWLMMQMYTLPLLMEQESKSLKLVMRNAAVLTLANPGFSITLLVLILILTLISIAVTILVSLITGALIAIIQQRAVVTLLERYRTATRTEL